ncbi:MAG: metallophosphoesterase [Nitrososphaeraceae archaeon]
MTKASLIPSHAALLLQYLDNKYDSNTRSLVIISDLHIGFEFDLHKKNILLDSTRLIDDILTEIYSISNKNHVDGIVILGDLKSSIYNINKIEWDLIPNFLSTLAKDFDVFLVPGNHDGNISLLAPDSIIMANTSGLVIDDTLLIHGHTMPYSIQESINRIIIGHVHPIFLHSSSILHGERIWIHLKIKREFLKPHKSGIIDLIIIPTFNKYYYSFINDTNRYKSKFKNHTNSISPIIRKVIENNAILQGAIFSLDGALIGDMSDFKKIMK